MLWSKATAKPIYSRKNIGENERNAKVVMNNYPKKEAE